MYAYVIRKKFLYYWLSSTMDIYVAGDESVMRKVISSKTPLRRNEKENTMKPFNISLISFFLCNLVN